MFKSYIEKMTKLTKLYLNFGENEIESVDVIVSSFLVLENLEDLSLELGNN